MRSFDPLGRVIELGKLIVPIYVDVHPPQGRKQTIQASEDKLASEVRPKGNVL